MSDFEEETYSTIFTSLKHSVRRKILRMLSEKPRSFTEMLKALGISSSHLTYHLESLGELVSKMDDAKYKLSTFGEAAIETMSKVEETPKVTEPNCPQSFSIKWKSFFVALLIGLVVLGSLSYIEYQSLNKMLVEYERLKELVELVKKGATLQYDYTLSYESTFEKSDSQTIVYLGSWYCIIYIPYDNSTLSLNIVLSRHDDLDSYLPISVQKGNVFTLGTNGIAPVIWNTNVTETGMYSLALISKGWYTISLIGPITNTYPFTIRFFEGIRGSIWLAITYEGNFAPFAVLNGWFPSLT